MNCKHCNFKLDSDYDVCPNCGKPLKEEAPEEKIDLPEKKEETSLSKEDEFTSNFISKDDPLKNIKEEPKTDIAMIVSRMAALIAVLFFLGVLYYTKVILPQLKPDRTGDIDTSDIYYDSDDDETPKSKKEVTTISAEFGDESILTQLKKYDFVYTKDMGNLKITLDYGKLSNGNSFSIVLERTNSSDSYNDKITINYNDNRINAYSRTFNSYNEDLITNIISSYVAYEVDGGVIFLSKASTFQLSNPTTILTFKEGNVKKYENIITTYSEDGSSISQCPITIDGNTINYCKIESEFKKGEEVTIKRMYININGDENYSDSFNALVSK